MAACVGEQVSAEANVAKRKSTSTGKPLYWQHRLFGKQLARCNQVNDVGRKSIDSATTASLVHEDGRPACEIIGMYFSFVNPGATCDDFTRQLVELYTNVNAGADSNNSGGGGGGGECDRRKKFEVVHVVLWSNVTDVLDFEESFRAHVADLPWLVVPNRDYERKVNIFFFFLSFLSVSFQHRMHFSIFAHISHLPPLLCSLFLSSLSLFFPVCYFRRSFLKSIVGHVVLTICIYTVIKLSQTVIDNVKHIFNVVFLDFARVTFIEKKV